MTRYDEHETCSICGDILNDVGGCDYCHGDPYFEDEWYEDDDDYDYWGVPTELVAPPPTLVDKARNLIERIGQTVRRAFRRPDSLDQIPF